MFFFDVKVWPDMTLMLKHWKIIVLIGVVLFVMTSPCPPFTLKCNTWEGTSVFTQTLMAHCGSSVTNVTHLSTSNVPLRNLKIVLGVRDLFVHFIVADNSKVQLLVLIYPPFFCFLISYVHLVSIIWVKTRYVQMEMKGKRNQVDLLTKHEVKSVAGRYLVFQILIWMLGKYLWKISSISVF